MIKSSCLSCQKLVQCLPAALQGGGRLQGRCCWGLSSRGWGQKSAAVGAFSSAPIWSPGARCFRNMANVGAHSPGRFLTEQASGWNTCQEPNVQHVFSDPLTLPLPQFPPVCPVLKMTAVLPTSQGVWISNKMMLTETLRKDLLNARRWKSCVDCTSSRYKIESYLKTCTTGSPGSMNWTIIYLNLIQMKSCILHFLISSSRRNVLSLSMWPSDLLYYFIDYTLEIAHGFLLRFVLNQMEDDRGLVCIPSPTYVLWSWLQGEALSVVLMGKAFQGLANSMHHHTGKGKLMIHEGLICCVRWIEWVAIWSLVACVLILGFSLISCVTLVSY